MKQETKKLITLLIAFLAALILYTAIVPAATVKTYKESFSWVTGEGKIKGYKVKARVCETGKNAYTVDIYSGKRKVESFVLTGKKPTVKFINPAKLTYKKLANRKGKNIIYIERCTGIVTEGKAGRDLSGQYIFYGRVKTAREGDMINSYFIYNPKTNYEDDITCRLDYKIGE